MTCIRIGSNAIVCVSPWGRLKVGNRYVWVDFHEWCGPAFFMNSDMNKVYDPVDENDPVWPEFTKWLDKHNAAKAKKQARSKTPNVGAKRAAEGGPLERPVVRL